MLFLRAMDEDKKVKAKDIFPVFFMGCLFVVIHIFSLFIIGLFEPAFEDSGDPINIAYILVILLVFTAIILLIAKYFKKQLIQIIILGAIGYTAWYIFLTLYEIIFPGLLAILFSIITAIVLVVALYKYPEWYVIDICGIIIGTGAIAIFGKSLDIYLVLILLIILAIYDAISVYKTRHMIDLADTVMDLKLPVLLVIPKIRNYSLIKETKSLKEKIKDGEERDAFFMGLGDIVMPGILVASVYNYFIMNNVDNGFLIALSVVIGTLVGFSILMIFVMKGKPQAGLPCLCGGAIIGYLVSSYVLTGELIGLTLPI